VAHSRPIQGSEFTVTDRSEMGWADEITIAHNVVSQRFSLTEDCASAWSTPVATASASSNRWINAGGGPASDHLVSREHAGSGR
jgi:hypothetical protein